jgi:hypothetical protein
MPVVKIDLKEIASKLQAEVIAIDAADMPQSQKTAAHKRAAQKVLNALYLDKRKFGGERLANRISLNTFSSYLTRIRKMLGELGLRHHLLVREVERMQKRYPLHAEQLAPLASQEATVDQLRIAKKSIQQALVKESELAEKLAAVDFAGKYKSALLALAKGYPDHAEQIKALVDDDGRPARMLNLQSKFAELNDLQADLHGLKIDHEVVVNLKMTAHLKDQKLQNQDQQLHKRQRSVFEVHYPQYISALGHMITQSWATVDGKTDWDFNLLVFGLCGATGRRPIEIILLGDLQKIDGERLLFSGAAKKRTDNRESHAIYSLLPSDLVLTAFKALRDLPYTKELAALDGDTFDLRSLEKRIGDRVSRRLSAVAQSLFYGREGARTYDTRAIYARICLTRYFNTDPRWERMSEDAFFSELLAHDTAEAQLHYKSVKLIGYEEAQAVPELVASRLERLRKLDHLVPDIARGDSSIKLHDWVKAQVAESPSKVINQSVIMREYGKPYRPMVQRYLELVADALMIQPGTSTDAGLPLAYPFIEKPAIIETTEDSDEDDGQLVDDDQTEEPALEDQTGAGEKIVADLDGEPEDVNQVVNDETPDAPTSLQRPRFRCRSLGDRWQVDISIGEHKEQFSPIADSMIEACEQAWEQWLAKWLSVKIVCFSEGKFSIARAKAPDGVVMEVATMGRQTEARNELALELEQRYQAYKRME